MGCREKFSLCYLLAICGREGVIHRLFRSGKLGRNGWMARRASPAKHPAFSALRAWRYLLFSLLLFKNIQNTPIAIYRIHNMRIYIRYVEWRTGVGGKEMLDANAWH